MLHLAGPMLHLVWWVSWTNVTLALPDVRRCSCDMLPDVIFLHVISGRTNVTSSWANVTLGLSTIPDVTLALPDVTCKNITSCIMLHVTLAQTNLVLKQPDQPSDTFGMVGMPNVTLAQLTHHTRCNMGPSCIIISPM